VNELRGLWIVQGSIRTVASSNWEKYGTPRYSFSSNGKSNRRSSKYETELESTIQRDCETAQSSGNLPAPYIVLQFIDILCRFVIWKLNEKGRVNYEFRRSYDAEEASVI